MPKLTKRLVESVKPADNDLIIRDSDTKGFILKVTPKGKRVYLLYYRTKEGRERKPAIGEHGKITCDQARDTAKTWLAEVHEGGDPSLSKQLERKAITLEELAAKYMRDYACLKKSTSMKEDQRQWKLHILPVLGRHKINSITKQDIIRLHQSMRESPIAANRVLALLSKAFNLAVEWGDASITANPVSGIQKYPEQSRERFLSSMELSLLGEALRHCEAEGMEMKSAILAIRLLLFTGCRRNEILELRWDWINFEHGKIDFPDSKTGKKSVYLNPPTLELLKNAERIKGNPFICIGNGKTGHLVNIQKPWNRIRCRAESYRLIDIIAEHEDWDENRIQQERLNAMGKDRLKHYRELAKKREIAIDPIGLEGVRIHDLRHGYASVGAAGGLSLLMIGKLLGHKEQVTTQKYAHLLADPMKEATNMIGQRIAAAMDGRQAEVIKLKRL